MSNRAIVRKFGGEYDQLSQMINESWKKDHDIFYDYSIDYLEWLLSSPQMVKELTLGCYLGEELIGFGAVVKKNIFYKNKLFKIILGTLFTTKISRRFFFP